MSDFVTVNGVDVRVGDNVRYVVEGQVKQIDLGDPAQPVRVGGDWARAEDIVSFEIISAPLVVGDQVIAKHNPAPNAAPHLVEALVDVGGVPHLVCKAWGGIPGLIAVPVANYERAKP